MKRYSLENGKMVEGPKGNYVSYSDASYQLLQYEQAIQSQNDAIESVQTQYEEAMTLVVQLHNLAFDQTSVKIRLQNEIDDLTSQIRRLENERGR